MIDAKFINVQTVENRDGGPACLVVYYISKSLCLDFCFQDRFQTW